MAIKRPDIYEHNNPVLAIVDSNFLKGGGRVVADLTALYALSDRPDQLKERVTRVYVTAESAYYVLVDDASIGTSAGWEVESSGGGSPSGVSGAIQFSDGSAFASDAANLFWDDTNNRLGIGTNAPTNLLHVSNTARLSNIYIGQAANTAISNTGSDTTINLNNGVGIAGSSIITPTARLHVQGSGSTSATTSLLVQNSAGTQLFKINDNRDVFLGSSTNYIHQGVFFQGDYHGVGNWNFGTASNLGARLGIKGSGATSATTALLVQNSAGTEAFKVNDAGDLFFNGLETSSMRIHTLGNTNKGISIDNEMDMGAFYGITFKTWDGSAYSNFMRINGNTASRGLIIGGTTNDASAKLQIDSTTQGFLPPRMTQAEILAIAAPATGLMAYNLDIGQVCVFDGAIWHKLSQSHM